MKRPSTYIKSKHGIKITSHVQEQIKSMTQFLSFKPYSIVIFTDMMYYIQGLETFSQPSAHNKKENLNISLTLL